MQDLNEIFHRRRERAMHKIQLNTKPNTKHSREKKTVLNIIATKLKEETVEWTNRKIIGMQCMQE